MSPQLGAAFGTGETVAFWVLAPIAVCAAVAVVTLRKAVHSALMLALVMLCLAGMYFAQHAPFLAVVQIVVYTGAVMMLFLFVVMLVGVDRTESTQGVRKTQAVAGVIAGLGFAALLLAAVGRASLHLPATNAGVHPGFTSEGHLRAIARELFTHYVFAFEVTSALLITAGLGAMVLTHRRHQSRQLSQRQHSEQRFRDFAKTGAHPGMLPPPGVYATANGVDVPALLPDGSVAPTSVSQTLQVRRHAVGRYEGAALPGGSSLPHAEPDAQAGHHPADQERS